MKDIRLVNKDNEVPEKDIDILKELTKELNRLGCFKPSHISGHILGLCIGSYANRDMFIMCGEIQKHLYDIAYFGGKTSCSLYLELNANGTWYEVLKVLRNLTIQERK